MASIVDLNSQGKRKSITALVDKINPAIRILIPVVLVIAALVFYAGQERA